MKSLTWSNFWITCRSSKILWLIFCQLQADQFVVEAKDWGNYFIRRDTDKSQYFAITELCYYSITKFVFIFKSLSRSSGKCSAIWVISHESLFSIMHDENVICSKTHLNCTVPEQIITCRQLFENYMVVSWPIKRKGKLHQMIINITITPQVTTTFPQQPLLFNLPTLDHSSQWPVKCVSRVNILERFDCIIISLYHQTSNVAFHGCSSLVWVSQYRIFSQSWQSWVLISGWKSLQVPVCLSFFHKQFPNILIFELLWLVFKNTLQEKPSLA